MRSASTAPRPSPTRDPTSACVETLPAADASMSRSDWLRLGGQLGTQIDGEVALGWEEGDELMLHVFIGELLEVGGRAFAEDGE